MGNSHTQSQTLTFSISKHNMHYVHETLTTAEIIIDQQYIMTNNEGEILDGFYIEILTLPTRNREGRAVFVTSYQNEQVRRSEFNYTEEEGVLLCNNSGPTQSFKIKISEVDGEVTAIKVFYDDDNEWEFVLLEEYLEEPSEVLDETCIFGIATVSF